MSPPRETLGGPSGLARSTGGAPTHQQGAPAAPATGRDSEMQDIGNDFQQESGESSTNRGEMDYGVSDADARAIDEGYDEDIAAMEEDEFMIEDEEDSQPPAAPGLADSMRGALNRVVAKPPAFTGEDPAENLRRLHRLATTQRKAQEAAGAKPEVTRPPTANPAHKRGASGSPVEAAPVSKKTKAFQFPFHRLLKMTRPLKCAFAIDKGAIVGNPFEPHPGMKISVKLDAGSLGLPSIGLNFDFSKDGTPVGENNEEDHYHHVTVGYEPGVKINGSWMLDNFEWEKAATPSDPTIVNYTYPAAIRQLCTSQREQDNLYFLSYTVNSHRATHYSEDWLVPLAGVVENRELANVDRTMTKMLQSEKGSYKVRLWFFDHRFTKLDGDDSPSIVEACLVPLKAAVTDHLRPLHQYRDEEGVPQINLDMPTIQQVGNGMYICQQKTKGDGTAKQPVAGRVLYHRLPQKLTWEQIEDFHIYTGVSVVREHDFNRGLHARMEANLHRVFLERLPIFEVDGIHVAADQELWRKTYWAGVRMARDKDGHKDTVPPEGSVMKLDFNADPQLPGGGQENKDQLWYGRVESRPTELLKQAGIDFWILVSMPRRTDARPPSFKNAIAVADGVLPLVRISVKVNPTMAKRELNAIANFCNLKFEPELLGEIRLALMSDPSRNTDVVYGDLTWGPKEKRSEANKNMWEALMVKYAITRTDNPAQMSLLQSPGTMRSNLVTCKGPPGTGKTKTLSDMIMALAKIGHTVLCVAAANTAVNLDARTVYHALGDEGRKTLKCLRLESDGAEQAAILSKVNYGVYSGEDPESNFGRAQYNEATKATNDPLMRNAIDKIAVQFAGVETEMEHYLKQYDTIDEVYAKVQQNPKLRKSDVDVGMTLEYHIWEITREDRQAAEDICDGFRHELGLPEYSRQVAAGDIDQDLFDKSAGYRKCVRNYIAMGGKIPRVQREQFEAASDTMISRVLARTNILFTTASNAGGKLLENGASFKPTVIICDEAGQISIPSLCVPLTCFNTWEGLFLISNPEQLEPPITSGQFNEFLLNAKLSPVAMLDQKGFPGLLLDTQYRMCPAISLFPSQQFYDGKLKDHPAARVDNENRRKMCEVSKSFGIYGPGQGGSGASASKRGKQARGQQDKRQGSEYMVINVMNGTSRKEMAGTSMVNYANAYAIIGVIDRMLRQHIDPRHIKILTYYHGQERLLQKLLNEIDPDIEENFTADAKAAIEISTVDAFGGRKASVIIVDMVAGKDPVLARAVKAAQKGKSWEDLEADGIEGQGEEENGSEDYVKTGTLTSYAKNPHRLNVALTRAKDGLVVVCQESLLCTKPMARKGKYQNALMSMVTNARQRALLFSSGHDEDLHPDASSLIRNLGGDTKVRALRKEQEKADRNLENGFIEQAKRAASQMRKQQTATVVDVPIYRTLQGHTTRPLAVGDREAADAHDRRVREEKEEKEI